MPSVFQQMARQVYGAEPYSLTGKIENIVGMSIEASGGRAAVGDICRIYNGDSGGQVTAEVVGFKNDHILLMPYSDMNGISAGNFVRNTGRQLTLQVGEFLRGRIINALGQPIDGKGPFEGGAPYCVGGNYINPLQRPPIRERIQFGVKAIDGMITIGKGQRIGIFAGSGVGKSTLMGMIAKNVTADINVIALVGERGREVLEFVEKDTPSMYAEMPKLLERSGNFSRGSITGVYTVLVEGDDTNEPIADTVRGILDGHIVLSRQLANSNHYPAIDVSASISRLMTEIVSPEHRQLASRIRDIMSVYEKNADLVSIGAYKPGTNRKLDFAMSKIDAVNSFLTQDVNEAFSYDQCVAEMAKLLQ